MAKVKIKMQGLNELQQRLLKMKDGVERRLNVELTQLGEDAVSHAKENKGYRDHTANLKNSISFALYKDGKLVAQGININDFRSKYKEDNGSIKENPLTEGELESQASDSLIRFASQNDVVAPKGFTLIIVAGMNYGKHVEDKGYNVLYLTGKWLHEKIKEILHETLEDAANL